MNTWLMLLVLSMLDVYKRQVQSRVSDFNSKLPDKLDEAEVLSTVMVSVGRAIAKR